MAHILLPVLCLFGLTAAKAVQAQQPEIFIRSAKPPVQRQIAPTNVLARCLANPADRNSCQAVTSRRDTNGVGFEAGEIGAVDYITCRKKHGVCLEVATLNLRKSAAKVKRLRSVDIEILFDLDVDTLVVSQVAKLKKLATALNDPLNRKSQFALIGHTDATGADDYNCNLARRRAETVRRRLAELGVIAQRLNAIGVGEFLLRYPANGSAAENRRVGFARISNKSHAVLVQMSQLCGDRFMTKKNGP